MTERNARRGGRSGAPERADTDQVRRQNRSLVLSTVRRRAPIARVDLGAATRLSPATITAITADLISEGLVSTVTVEHGARGPEADGEPPAPTVRGRPRILLQLNAEVAYVLAVKVAFNKIVLVVADYEGTVLARREESPPTLRETRTSFPRLLVALIHDFLAAAKVPLRRVAEIGIAAQGFVDQNTGSVVWSPAFSERDIELVRPVRRAFGIPCFITNDANMIAQALHWADPVVYGGTFAVIFVDYGVGMGLFVGNKLHAGADGSAAEIGHMNHIPGGPLCRCGRRGCLEAFVADYAIWREASAMSPDTDPADARPSAADLLALEAAAKAGDDRIAGIYHEAGRALGYGIARLMALVNPGRIVFTGASTRAFPLIEAAMHEGIADALVEDLRRNTIFQTLPWDQDMIITGLIADALARLDGEVFAATDVSRRTEIELPREERA